MLLSVIGAARSFCHIVYGFGKLVEVCPSSVEQLVVGIVSLETNGFFTGSGNVFPFWIDLVDLCRCFGVDIKATITVYIGHDLLSIIGLLDVIGRNGLFEINTTISQKLNFRTPKKSKLWGTMRRFVVFIVIVRGLMQHREKYSISTKKGRALNSDHKQVIVKCCTNGCVQW